MKRPTKFLPGYLIIGASLLFFTQNIPAESLPEYRPALLGNYKRSLINLIDTQALMKRGQKDAVVLFECGVSDQGRGFNSRTFRASPNSELLAQELLGRIDQAQFEPAVYRHNRVDVYVHGTVSFVVKDGKPHLRIFLNQSEDELKSGQDFIAPQFAFVPNNTAFKGIYYPPQAPGHSGMANLRLKISAEGKVENAMTEYEYPPKMNFGAQAVGPIFIPGFRNGKPVACQVTWTMIYSGVGRQMKTG